MTDDLADIPPLGITTDREPRAAPAVPPPPGSTPAVSGAWLSTKGQRAVLLVSLLVVAWFALNLFASVLLPFVAAAGIAYALDPPTHRLNRLGVPRSLAAALIILALIAAALLFALLLYPLIVVQLGLLIGRGPQYVALLQEWAGHMMTSLQQSFGQDVVNDKLRDLVAGQAGTMLSYLAPALTHLIGGGFVLVNVLTLVVVTPIVAFYLLRDWRGATARIDGWVPPRYRAVVRAQATEVDRILSAWVRGQALCCLILAAYYAAALTAVGLELGLIVGLTAGLLSFIPYVGSITGGITALALAAAQFQSWRGVLTVAAVLLVGQFLEGYVIYPRFLGDRVELPDVWVIFALFAGGAAFGFLGVMLAVPVAATIGVLCRFWLRRYLASPLYHDPR